MTNMFIATCLIGGALSFWIARRISKPLRNLRNQVLHIAAGNIENKVAVPGSDEISEVAAAINTLAGNLSQNIRSMRELLANISHELRSPLARMGVSATIIEENLAVGKHAAPRFAPVSEIDLQTLPELARIQKHASLLIAEIEYMEGLIGTTLLNSKLDLQETRLEFSGINLSELCAEALCREHDRIVEHGLRLSAEIEPNVSILADEDLIRLVISNLLDNAIKFNCPGGQIRLELARNTRRLSLSVENSCSKLPDEALERIFDPFYRVDQKNGNGVGLGLTLVRKITLLHGGWIRVENNDAALRVLLEFPGEVCAC